MSQPDDYRQWYSSDGAKGPCSANPFARQREKHPGLVYGPGKHSLILQTSLVPPPPILGSAPAGGSVLVVLRRQTGPAIKTFIGKNL